MVRNTSALCPPVAFVMKKHFSVLLLNPNDREPILPKLSDIHRNTLVFPSTTFPCSLGTIADRDKDTLVNMLHPPLGCVELDATGTMVCCILLCCITSFSMMTTSLSIQRYSSGRAIHPHCSVFWREDQLWCRSIRCHLASVVRVFCVPFWGMGSWAGQRY